MIIVNQIIFVEKIHRIGTRNIIKKTHTHTCMDLEIDVPVDFVYSLHDPPLHVRLKFENTNPSHNSVLHTDHRQNKQKESIQNSKRVRDYFKTIKNCKTSFPHITLLESGQTHGEFCICYLQSMYERRKTNSSRKNKSTKVGLLMKTDDKFNKKRKMI